MSNGASRDKGAVAERQLAAALRPWWPYVERNKIGVSNADLLGMGEWLLECKNRKSVAEGARLSVAESVRYADELKGDYLPVGVVKPKGVAEPLDWYAIMRVRDWNRIAVERDGRIWTPNGARDA